MNCQDCGANDAFVHLTEIVDGEVRSIWLCTRCSRRRQNAGQGPYTGSAETGDDSENLVSFPGRKGRKLG